MHAKFNRGDLHLIKDSKSNKHCSSADIPLKRNERVWFLSQIYTISHWNVTVNLNSWVNVTQVDINPNLSQCVSAQLSSLALNNFCRPVLLRTINSLLIRHCKTNKPKAFRASTPNTTNKRIAHQRRHFKLHITYTRSIFSRFLRLWEDNSQIIVLIVSEKFMHSISNIQKWQVLLISQICA